MLQRPLENAKQDDGPTHSALKRCKLGVDRVEVAHSAERLKPSADDRRPIQPGTQRDEAIPNCFGQTVECDYLSFLRAHEATQVTCPCLLPGVNHPLNVHIQLGARCLSVEP